MASGSVTADQSEQEYNEWMSTSIRYGYSPSSRVSVGSGPIALASPEVFRGSRGRPRLPSVDY